jgi:hypothetical protein
MEPTPKPVPIVNPCARPFWEAARQGRLMLPECLDCRTVFFYPRLFCPECHSDRLDWVQASGRGTLYSYTVVQSNSPSAFLADIPYVVAIVRLEEGVQMCTNIVGCPPDQLRCDMPVEVVFEKLNDEFTLPKFKPVSS